MNRHLSGPYLAERLPPSVPALTLGGCCIPASNTTLQAPLSSAFFSLRQIVISSAFEMNSLQNLSTSSVHALRCASVPCEKEGAAEIVAHSKASDTHFCGQSIERSIQLFWFSMFTVGLPSIIEADTRHRRRGV
jgi:hypothetical protein